MLGKVAGPLTHDEPILSRNKVLERMRPEAVDELVRSMNESLREQTKKVTAMTQVDEEDVKSGEDEEDAGSDGEDGVAATDIFDLNLDARVTGASVRVIPIAVYL